MIFMTIVGNQNVINVVVKDYFDIVGTIINTLVIIYYLFIIKFNEIYAKKDGTASHKTYVRIM